MAKVNICNVEVLDNPASFFSTFKFQVTFECHEPLDDDLEWKLVYVSSAYNVSLDQTLDSILVGPVPVGRHQFIFEADPPDPKKIPMEDIVGVTVVLIQALYRDKEFIRVGYYVNNEYKKEELRQEPPSEPILDELERHVIASDPRVTRFPIDWGDGLLDGCPEPQEEEDASAVDNATGDIMMASSSSNYPGTGKEDDDEGEEDEDDDEEDDEEEDGDGDVETVETAGASLQTTGEESKAMDVEMAQEEGSENHTKEQVSSVISVAKVVGDQAMKSPALVGVTGTLPLQQMQSAAITNNA